MLSGCTAQIAGTPSAQTSVTVSPNGGDYAVGGMTVTVPKGAVGKPTTLTIGDPRVVNGADAPLGTTAVRFDVSLTDGAEPAQPLQLHIPLQGRFLPTGAQPANAVFYTSTADGKDYRLLPYTVQNGVLTATVPHLSDKEIAFVDPQTLAKTIAHTQPAPAQSDCTKQQLPGVGEIDVMTANNGNGRVGVCLSTEGSNLALHLTDKANYTWSVQSPDLQFAVPLESVDDSMSRVIAATLLHEPDVHNYLVHDGELDVKSVTPQSVPLTLNLLTSNNGLLAEALWDVTKTMVALYTGENAKGTADVAKKLAVDVPDVSKCLTSVLDARSGNIGDYLKTLPDAVFGKCGETIGGALIKLLPDAANLINPFTKTLAVLQATWDVLQGLWHAAVAVAQTAQGAVEISLNPCPDEQTLESLVRQNFRPEQEPFGDMVCQSGWFYKKITGAFSSNGARTDPTKLVAQWKDGGWKIWSRAGTGRYGKDEDICVNAPKMIFDIICHNGTTN